eukprot:COSAG06_NODE_21791_length_745_cov_0.849845_2_plen_46_part_01
MIYLVYKEGDRGGEEAAKTRLRLIRLRRGAATRLRGGGDRMQRATS